MLFEKVMEEGRSYLKSEMAHRGGASWARACIRVHPARMLSAVQRAKVRAFKREQAGRGPMGGTSRHPRPEFDATGRGAPGGKTCKIEREASALPPCGGP